MGSPVDDVEAIKILKARYFRAIDTKDWDTLRALVTDDAVFDTAGSGGPVFEGADAFIGFLRETLDGVVTVHHGHMPEIETTSATSATGVWAMEDLLQFPDTDIRGYGHYHETYAKQDGRWRIASSRLTRLRMDALPRPAAT